MEDQNQTIIEHLTELRTRLVYSAIGIAFGFAVCWVFSEQLFNIVRGPIEPYLPTGGLVFTAPMDKFLAHVKVSLLGGIIVSTPVWSFQIWKFIAPGLYKDERKFGVLFMSSGTFLFLSGVSFVYFLVFPMAFKFLMAFGGETDQAMITIERYLSFFILVTLVFGAMFQLPLVLTLLGMMGWVTKEFLKKNRRYAIVLLSALSALVTPPDVISMLMMMVPMVLLYEISVFLVGVVNKPKATA